MQISLKDRVSKLVRQDISKKVYLITVILLIAAKLIASFTQHIAIYPYAPIDDGRMFEAAQSISRGEWLGAYNWLTLAKHMFFSVWLWLLNVLHIPYLVGGQLLFLSGCILTVKAFENTVFERRLTKLIVFCFMWFMPYSWAESSLRVYRDNISLSLCLIFFSGMTGLCLRYKKECRRWPFAVAAGLGFGLSYLTREDAIWLLPFALCAALIYAIFVLVQKNDARKKLKSLLQPILAAAVCGAALCGYAFMNYLYYDTFIISTYAAPAFSRAVSLMVSLDNDMPHIGLMVCRETREKISAQSPEMAEFCAELDNGSYYHGYSYKLDESGEEREFGAGGYSWMFRAAAFNLGADTPKKEDEFWNSLADSIQLAIDEGRLVPRKASLLSKVSPFIPPWDSSFLGITLNEIGSSFKVLFCFEQNSPVPELSVVEPEIGDQWLAYTHSILSNHVAKYNTSEVMVFWPQRVVQAIYSVILWIYRILFIPLFIYSLVYMAASAVKGIKRIKSEGVSVPLMLAVLLFGMLLSAVLRIAVVSYIEVTSFLIGTYLMYLASAGAVLFVFTAAGLGSVTERIIAGVRQRRTE